MRRADIEPGVHYAVYLGYGLNRHFYPGCSGMERWIPDGTADSADGSVHGVLDPNLSRITSPERYVYPRRVICTWEQHLAAIEARRVRQVEEAREADRREAEAMHRATGWRNAIREVFPDGGHHLPSWATSPRDRQDSGTVTLEQVAGIVAAAYAAGRADR